MTRIQWFNRTNLILCNITRKMSWSREKRFFLKISRPYWKARAENGKVSATRVNMLRPKKSRFSRVDRQQRSRFERLFAAIGHSGSSGAVVHGHAGLPAFLYAGDKFTQLGNVGFVPAGQKIGVALPADTVLVHNLQHVLAGDGWDAQCAPGSDNFGFYVCTVGGSASGK